MKVSTNYLQPQILNSVAFVAVDHLPITKAEARQHPISEIHLLSIGSEERGASECVRVRDSNPLSGLLTEEHLK